MRSILLLACLAALGCSGSPTASTGRELGFLEYHGTSAEVTVPETARVGEPFAVRVVTWGGGCTEKGETDVTRSGTRVDVRPYDLTASGADIACPDILLRLVHEATVRFDAPGTATVRVHGRVEPGARTIVVTRTVVIQPAS
jgi:hypothetical protein